MVLRQAPEVLHGVPVLVLGRAIEADDDLADVRHLRELFDDVVEGTPSQFGVKGRQHKRHWTLARQTNQLVFQIFEGAGAELMQRRDTSVLEEIAHGVASVAG